MDQLPVPFLLAGARIQRHERVPIEIVPSAIRAIEVVSWRAQRRVHDPALYIDREEAPHIRARSVFPGTGRPGLRPRLARAGHGVKSPQQLARPGIPTANVPIRTRAGGALAIAASRNDRIAQDGPRRLELISAVFKVAQHTPL